MTYKWTFMVYMAGDNGRIFDDDGPLMDNLVGFGWDDIREMSEVGSTNEVAIVVQYDTLDANETPRLFIDGADEKGTVVEKVPPVNTGDPKNLTDFIVWATKNYPAEKRALILWNHGTGWKEEDIYERYRHAEEASRRDQIRAARSRKRLLNQAFFLPTAAEIMSIADDEVRAICYDDSSMDFLDNQDLVTALGDAESQTGQRLSLLGMDACLMSMIEVAYQLHEYAEYMVGSQEIEEATGWPYDRILGRLVDSPGMSSLELNSLIVAEFGDYYSHQSRDGGGINTQAAIDLRAIPRTFTKIKTLARRIAEVHETDFQTKTALIDAKYDAQSFRDEDYLDLRHLMDCFAGEYYGSLEVGGLAAELAEHLTPEAPESPIVANFHGLGRPNANGLSVYFPARSCSPFYDKQAFALSGWNKVIRRANRLEVPMVSAVGQLSDSGAELPADLHRVTCPICEGQTVVPIDIADIDTTVAVEGLHDRLVQIVEAIHQVLVSSSTGGSPWADLSCPHCDRALQYNVQTRETRR